MKTSTTVSLLIFLVSSCVSIPYRPVYQYKHFSNHCAVRCFNYNILKVTEDKNCGEDFKTNLKMPAYECDGVLGPMVDDYAQDIKPKALENIQEYHDLKKQSKN